MHEEDRLDDLYDGLDHMMEDLPPVRGKKQKKKDPKLDFLLLQVTACVALLLAALVIKLVGGGFYAEAREKYIELFEDQTTISEVVESMAGVFQMTPEEEPASSEGGQSSSQPAAVAPGASSSAPSVSSGDSAADQPDSSGAPASSQEGVSSGASSEADAETSAAPDGATPPVADGGGATASLKRGEEEDDVTSYAFDLDQARTVLPTAGSRSNSLLAPVSGTVTSRFGFRTHPITGAYSMHGGLDIGAEEGTGIQAAMDGVVKTVAQSESYGLYIVVDHQNGFETWYAQCSKLLAQEGDQVERGEVIARVGQTGYATGPHCHFEVRVQGVKLNPEWLLRMPEAA